MTPEEVLAKVRETDPDAYLTKFGLPMVVTRLAPKGSFFVIDGSMLFVDDVGAMLEEG